MSQVVPREFDEFVAREIASGKYRSHEEVVSAGLRLLQERERKLESLRADIQVGLDQLDRGEGITLETEEAQRAFFEDVKARGRERLASEQSQP